MIDILNGLLLDTQSPGLGKICTNYLEVSYARP